MKCPYCEFVAEDGNSWQEIAHMQVEHPEIITARLAGAGILDADVEFGRDPVQKQRDRLLDIAARALERTQVGDADEATALLEQVVTLDGKYVPPK